MITLIQDTVSREDVNKLADWLRTFPRLTKGPLTKIFEEQFSAWLGVDHSVMVNSGSSANLLMLYALKVMGKMKNRKVVVPGLCWATDLAPVIQFEMHPILCDCNLDNLSVDVIELEELFKEHSPSALMLVSILGLSPDMKKIIELCDKYDVILLEDACESLGTTYNDKKLGSFGLMSSHSFFFGHHASTVEGGMICTNDPEVNKVLLSIRSHGWNRDWDKDDIEEIEKQYNISNINSMYTFYYPGFNLRATDIQAFIGIEQIKMMDWAIWNRNENFKLYQSLIENPFWKPKELPNTMTSNFAYPYMHPLKYEVVVALEENDIETRPLVCGSMGIQPFYTNIYGKHFLKNCDVINNNGIYLPNHPHLKESDIEKVCKVVNEVVI
jgi:CDP-6-deoxy-D-xylo-4-hexulose-3-dehydrase